MDMVERRNISRTFIHELYYRGRRTTEILDRVDGLCGAPTVPRRCPGGKRIPQRNNAIIKKWLYTFLGGARFIGCRVLGKGIFDQYSPNSQKAIWKLSISKVRIIETGQAA